MFRIKRSAALTLVVALVLACVAMIPLRPSKAAADNTTESSDGLRTGWDQNEPGLAPSTVSAQGFGQQFSTAVSGSVYGQPLVIGNTVLVTTEKAIAYSIDATTGAINWTRSFGSQFLASTFGNGCVDLVPDLGSTSTPVYDPATGSVYITTKLSDGSWYLQGISLADGTNRPGFPIAIQGTASNDPTLAFNAYQHQQRPGLLLANGVVYIGFGSLCDQPPWDGWVAAVSVNGTPTIKSLWAAEVGTGSGGGIWQSGGGLVTDGNDSAGNPRVFVSTGNGLSAPASPGTSVPGTLGDSTVRIGFDATGKLVAKDYFSPSDAPTMNNEDLDLGAGGPLALPDSFGTPAVPHLLVQMGKDGRIFLLNRDNLGGRSQGPGGTDADVQTLGPFGGVWGHPAAYGGEGGWVYYTEVAPSDNTGAPTNGGGPFRALQITSSGGIPALSPVGTSSEIFPFSSGSPVVSSTGTTAGSALVWVIQSSWDTGANAQLLAYDAVPVNGHLNLRWSAPIGTSSKFESPVTSGGRVYVGTRDGHLLAFGSSASSTLSAQPVNFGLVAVNTTANSVAHLTASGTVTINSASVTGPFTANTAGILPATLTAGSSLDIPVSFTPTTASAANGTLTLSTNLGPVKVNLSGVGTSPGLASNPSTVAFGSAPTGGPPDQLNAVITNTGTATETVSSVAAPAAPFSATGLPTSGTQIPAQQSITVSVSYSPPAPGTYSSSLSITSTSGTLTVPITGSAVTGQGHLTLTPTQTDFGPMAIGSSGTLNFKVSNTGNIPITITATTPPTGVFNAATPPSCGGSCTTLLGWTLNPGDIVTQPVSASPTAPGPVTGQYTLTANDGQGPINETLTAIGLPGPGIDGGKFTGFSASGKASAAVSTTQPGDLLVAYVAGDKPGSGSGQTATVSASGLTWTLAKRVDTSPGTAEVWTARASGVLSGVSVSAQLSQAANVELTVVAYSNAAGIGAVAGGSNTGGAPTASLTTTQANSWVSGVGFDWTQGVARTLGAGQTLIDQVLQPGGTFWTQSQTLPTPASGTPVTINDTAPTTDYWNLAAVEILPAGASSPPPVLSSVAAGAVGSTGATINWTTDQASSSQVDYGPTSAYGTSSPLDATLVVSHSVTLSGLAPSTTYHFRVDSSDANGLVSSVDATFTTTSGPPPVISSIAVGAITSSGATITWTTDQASSSQVDYGPTSAYGTSSPLNATLVVSHSVTLSGLASSTTYHFRVDSGTSRSADNTFTTLVAPPAISNIAATATTTGATITWTTDQASSSQVDYGPTSSYGTSSSLSSTPVVSHSVTLTGLAPSTTYHFRVDSSDANGLSRSPDTTFATQSGSSFSPPAMDGAKVSAFSSTGTTSAVVSTTQPGDLLVAFVSGDKPGSGSGQTSTVSSSGLTWTPTQRVNTQPGTAEVWTARVSGVLSGVSVSAQLSQAANVELTVVAFSNAGGIGAVGGGNNSSGAPTASLTTTQANSWVFGVGFDWTQGLPRTLGAGQTLVDQVVQKGGTFWVQSQTVPTSASGTPVTINDTAPTTDYWNLAIVEILGSSSAPAAPVITSANTTTFVVGSAGTFTVVATGSPAPSFAETGTLPSGVTLSTAGVLSGTPAAGTSGSYPITITAANGVAPNATQNFTLTVNQAPAITSANATTFVVGTAGTFTVVATGSPAPTFTETGALPAGVTLTTAGVLSGTPAAGTSGSYPITITAANGVAPNATQNFTLTVSAGPSAPAITSANATAFAVGSPGTFTVAATGSPAPTFTETGALPAGVTLSTAGVLSGTPATGTAGVYPITITAANGVAPNATQNFTLTVNQAPAITSANATTFVVGTAGTFTVVATGSPAPTFNETGTLPAGITLSTAGVLSGTPAAGTAGVYPVTVTAANGVAPNATQNFTLTVNQPPTITSANATMFAVGSAGTFTVVATGRPAPTFTESGVLPSGVTLSLAGVLSGTPAAGTSGTYPITITAANGVTPNASQNFTLTVNAGISAPAIDTKSTGFSSTGTASASVSTTKASDLLVAFVSGDKPGSGSGQTATVSGGGLTWTLARRTDAQPGTAEIWTARASATMTAVPITTTLAQAANVELVVIAFANSSGAGAVGGGSAGGGPPTAKLTTTRANSWVFGVGFDWYSGIARTLGTGQTLQDQVLQPGGTFWTQSQSAATPANATSVTINDTAPTSDVWDLSLVEILGA